MQTQPQVKIVPRHAGVNYVLRGYCHLRPRRVLLLIPPQARPSVFKVHEL